MTADLLPSITLTSLAMLKVHADAKERHDYIDYLKPFVVYVLTEHKPFPVSREKVQEFLLQEFGLKVPVYGCELILKRLTKLGYLNKSYSNYFLKKELPASDIPAKKVDAMRRSKSVVAQLTEFAKAKYSIEYSDSQATAIFLNFVSFFAIECLSTYAKGTALPDIGDSNSKDKHVVAAFIKVAEQKNIGLFEDIVLLVKGNMLANALLCEDLDSQRQKFNDVTFYLDTPIILDILGLHGEHKFSAAMELLKSVTQLSGKFAVFEHILAETEKVLKHCETNAENPQAANRVLTHIREKGKTSSDIALIRNNLQRQLMEYGIQIEQTPMYAVDYQIDEKAFQEVLEANSQYSNPNTRDIDINSVRSIYVLRKGKRPRRLEETKAVFVTPNWRFAKESYRFGQEYEELREVSPVITDFSLGNIAWLKSPLETEELPKLELLASCYAIMQPNSFFWEKFLNEVEKLKNADKISSDDHAFLRSDYRVPSELIEMTLGTEDDLTEGTILEIMGRLKISLTLEKNEEIQQKEKALQFEKSERQKMTLQNQRVINKVDTFCVFVGRLVAIILGILMSAFLIAGLLFPCFSRGPVSWLFFVGAAVLTLMTILNLIFGVTVRKICSNVAEKTSGRIKNILLSKLGIKPEI